MKCHVSVPEKDLTTLEQRHGQLSCQCQNVKAAKSLETLDYASFLHTHTSSVFMFKDSAKDSQPVLVKTRSHTKGVDALWANLLEHPANLSDTVDICQKH